jgi:multidrug resistance efflux pump
MENNITEKVDSNGNGAPRRRLMFLAGFVFLVAGVVALFYLYLGQSQVYVENSSIVAPTVNLSSANGGTLQKMLVSAGDQVAANTTIAQVGNDLVKTNQAGTIISVSDTLGKNFAPNEAVAEMINTSDLRVVAQLEEDKGLNAVKVGQKAYFTVDAFGSQKFTGIVDEVSPTARSGDIVFNISSARQEQEFDVKIRFDTNQYPQLKNGMSAKVWIYKN